MFGWVIVVVASSGSESLFEWALAGSAALMVVTAAPALYRQYRDDLEAGLGELQRKRRDQPKVLVLVLTAGLIFVLSGYADDFGRSGMLIVAVVVSALFVFSDLRPDLMRELARPAARPTKGPSG
jgi:cobalamin synthase